jgi:cell wall-associated NlpC family hydrolase
MNIQELEQFVNDMKQLAVNVTTLNGQNADLTADKAALQAEIERLHGEITPSWKMKADRVISAGKALMAADIPYLHGGNDYHGFDCSRLMQVIFSTVGVKLPRVSDDQRQQGTDVQLADIRPGDLIAFNRLGNDGIYDHIGVSLGGSQMLHTAGNPEGINICDWTTRYKGVTYTIRRVL